jgi:hypothetical protein
MKNIRLNSILGSSLIACALTVGMLSSTPSASAQISTNLAVVDIPFAFQTSTRQTLPAGTYRINRESGQLILLRGPAKSGFVQVHDTIKLHAPNRGYLVFDRYGDKYFLRQIWTAGETVGLESPKSRAEKETMQAKNMQSPTSIELAFNSVPQF